MPANYEQLAETKTWVNGIYALAGFVAPVFLRRLIEDEAGTDLPDEVYGFGVAALAITFATGNMKNFMVAGASMHVVLKLLERFDIIQPVVIETTG